MQQHGVFLSIFCGYFKEMTLKCSISLKICTQFAPCCGLAWLGKNRSIHVLQQHFTVNRAITRYDCPSTSKAIRRDYTWPLGQKHDYPITIEAISNNDGWIHHMNLQVTKIKPRQNKIQQYNDFIGYPVFYDKSCLPSVSMSSMTHGTFVVLIIAPGAHSTRGSWTHDPNLINDSDCPCLK